MKWILLLVLVVAVAAADGSNGQPKVPPWLAQRVHTLVAETTVQQERLANLDRRVTQLEADAACQVVLSVRVAHVHSVTGRERRVLRVASPARYRVVTRRC